MFVRSKVNRSGSVSVQVVDKAKGYRVVATIGCSREPEQLRLLVDQAQAWIRRHTATPSLFPDSHPDHGTLLDFLDTLDNASVRTLGPELIFGKLFDLIGFDAIPEPLLRDIVIARLAFPTSKLKTVDYLLRYQGKIVQVDRIYRFLDRLDQRHADRARRIVADHSRSILKSFSVVFYDMTTLYFEAEDEDDLRKIGFSKDGKFQNPQIMIGLLVGENGFPIGYDVFEGNTFEGKTLLPVLERIQKQFGLSEPGGGPVVVADAAMLSRANLDQLKQAGYQFIVAARIHNESDRIRQQILDRSGELLAGQFVSLDHPDGHRLIVAYSPKRARKDAHNRQRGIERLRQNIRSGKLTKSHINSRGYNKFLKLKGPVEVEIDERSIEQAAAWDGLKGYLTNTTLPAEKVIESYGQLWQIERAFRISKTDLRVRPIYHRLRRRIEAHVLVSFMAYAIHKELERRLSLAGIAMSGTRASELTRTMYGLRFKLPGELEWREKLLKMDSDQQGLYEALQK